MAKKMSNGKSPDNLRNARKLLSGVPMNAATMEPCRMVRLPNSPTNITAKDTIILLKCFMLSPHLKGYNFRLFSLLNSPPNWTLFVSFVFYDVNAPCQHISEKDGTRIYQCEIVSPAKNNKMTLKATRYCLVPFFIQTPSP